MGQNKDLQLYQERNAVDISMNDNEIYFDIEKFEMAQRVCKMLSQSTMIPEHFRNNIGNCMIALNFAARAGLDVFGVMQKMYIIHGKPGIEGQLAIALINKSGKFTPLRFRFDGEGKNRSCTAYAKDTKTGEECEQTVSWQMVEKEGWSKKSGSKWQTMPDLMFQYRSATFFGRLYCPEALLGMQTKEEIYDIDNTKYEQKSDINNLLNATTSESQEHEKKPEKQEFDFSKMKELSQNAFEMVEKELGLPKTQDDFDKFQVRFDEITA